MFFRYRWPNSVLYYTIDAAFTNDERAIIAAGIANIQDNSCIEFVPRTDEFDYVDIVPGSGGCYAYLPWMFNYDGRPGRLELGLQRPGCVYGQVVIHELLHSLGFLHEMNRPDRDQYVEMVWSNIQVKTSLNLPRPFYNITFHYVHRMEGQHSSSLMPGREL